MAIDFYSESIKDPIAVVVDYWLDQIWGGDARPPEVALALCALRWPDGRWVVYGGAPGDDEDDLDIRLVTLKDVHDLKTGMSAHEAWKEVIRAWPGFAEMLQEAKRSSEMLGLPWYGAFGEERLALAQG